MARRPHRKVKIRPWDVLLPIYAFITIAVWIHVMLSPAEDPYPMMVETAVGLRADRAGNGDWLISVVTGSYDMADIRMVVLDAPSNTSVINTTLRALDATDGTYNNSNGNSKLDAGDSILLHDTAAVDAGMMFRILNKDSIVGTIRELPA